MGASSTTTVNFGSFPGSFQANAVVTGQSGILSGSLVEAWAYPVVTADHSIDEQFIDVNEYSVVAASIVAGTGFTIYAQVGNGNYPLYGLYNVAWVWN